jgi:hypothetical protein
MSEKNCTFASQTQNTTRKEVIMQATLSYNPRNQLAQRTLDYILSLGVFRLETPTVKTKSSWLANDFKAAMQEVKAADKGLVQLKDAEDLLNEL